MTEEGKKYLSDILSSIELIEQFIVDTSDYNDYLSDIKTQSAVERQLGIIGEAVNKFDKHFPEDRLKNTKKIIGLRNRLIHGYDTIDPSIIWAVIKKHLQPLKSEIRSIL